MARSLRRNFAWTFSGNAVYAATRWLTFAVLAKLLTPDDVGLYALGIAIATPVFAFAGMNLRSIQSTDAKRELLFRDYFAVRLPTIAVALVITTGIALGYDRVAATRHILVLAGLIQAVDWSSDLLFGLFEQRERFEVVARSQAIRGTLRLASVTTSLFLRRDLVLAMSLELAANALVLVAHDLVLASRFLRDVPDDGLWPRWNPVAQRQLLRLSLPMAALLLMVSLQTNLPRYFVDHYRGQHALGIFAALSVLAVAATPLVTAIGQASMPRMARCWMERDGAAFFGILRRILLLGSAIGVLGVLGAAAIGPQLLRVLYTPEYASQGTLLVILMGAATIGYVANGYAVAITATRRYGAPLAVQAIGFPFVFPVYVLMTSVLGTIGTAIALAVQCTITLVGYAAILHKRGIEL